MCRGRTKLDIGGSDGQHGRRVTSGTILALHSDLSLPLSCLSISSLSVFAKQDDIAMATFHCPITSLTQSGTSFPSSHIWYQLNILACHLFPTWIGNPEKNLLKNRIKKEGGLGHTIFLRTCLGSGFLNSWGSPLGEEMDVVKTPVVRTDARGRGSRKEGRRGLSLTFDNGCQEPTTAVTLQVCYARGTAAQSSASSHTCAG